jgi:hypothetical protein
MRILFTIPHYASPGDETAGDGRAHASVAKNAETRASALATCVTSLHRLFHVRQGTIDHFRKTAHTVTPLVPYEIDVVVCTTHGRHLLERLDLPAGLFEHLPTEADPASLGFECQRVLRDRMRGYDFCCYLEDDIILHDPWLFLKLAWFNRHLGDERVLQPNRYESGLRGAVNKLWVDGELRAGVTEGFQDVNQDPLVSAEVMGIHVQFRRPLNPHSGCFFLNRSQMDHWACQRHFLDRDIRFIGPLESAATLGVMRTFKVYKPALENGDFLEVEHFGTDYLNMVKERA